MRIGLVGSRACLGICSELAYWPSFIAAMFDVPEDQSSSDTSYATHTNECRRAERTFPLSADVVGLVRHDCRYVAVCTSSGQENT
jgi:hypothetical protein